MRILHVLDHSLPLQSGYSFRTVAILREQRALGWETFQVTTPRHGEVVADRIDCADGWKFYRTALAAGWVNRIPVAGGYMAEMVATANRLDSLIEELRPDVLHAHSPVLTALPALRAGKRHGVPVVYEVRALWEDGAVDHGTTRAGSARYRLTRAIETYALGRAARVTTICAGLRNEIVQRGIESSHVTVIPNAVDTDKFHFDPAPDADLRQRLGLDGKTVLSFIGSFYGYEGLELLVDGLALIGRERPDVHLLLAGGGPSEPAVRERVKKLGLQDRVIFSGRIPHDDIWRYYSVADLMVYPRLCNRITDLVTPLKPLEAMAQGRLVLASDVGGHRELINDGHNGFLFRAGDAHALAQRIASALDNLESWGAIRLRARRFVEEERTWRDSVARYREVYSSAVNARTELK